MGRIADVAGAIVTVALVSTIFTSPQAAGVFRAIGDAFGGSIRAARGR